MQDASEVRTIKLYDEDAYRTEFEARVLSARYREDGNGRVCDLVLDRTCFFPEEGLRKELQKGLRKKRQKQMPRKLQRISEMYLRRE